MEKNIVRQVLTRLFSSSITQLLIAITVLFLLVTLLQKPFISLVSWMHMLPQSEAFTQLYFENNAELPTQAFLGSQSFQFTVQNDTGKTESYPYQVYLLHNDTKTQIDSNSFALQDTQKRTVSEAYTLQDTSSTTQVVVSLIGLHQQIDYWLRAPDTL